MWDGRGKARTVNDGRVEMVGKSRAGADECVGGRDGVGENGGVFASAAVE
jgi:hypothetical protein